MVGGPGVPTLTADVTRGSINDWGSPPTARASSNPAVALWDYLSVRLGVTAGEIDSTSWEAVRTDCDVDPGDGTAKWSIDMAVTGDTPNDCIDAILLHCFGHGPYYWDGKYYLDNDRVKGTAALTLVEEDGDALQPMTWSRPDLFETPNAVEVNYFDLVAEKWLPVKWTLPGTTQRARRSVTLSLPGCGNGSMAARYKVQWLQLANWASLNGRLLLPPKAMKLSPGDRIDYTSRAGLSAQSFLIRDLQRREDGMYEAQVVEYDVERPMTPPPAPATSRRASTPE